MRDFDKRMEDFDREFARTQQRIRRFGTLTVGGCILYGILTVGILAGCVYTAVHFIHKAW